MKSISLAALAAAVLVSTATLTAGPAQAACSYQSKEWKEKGIVQCSYGWAPIGFPGTRWKVSRSLTQCWNTYGAGGREYQGYWAPCK